MKKSNLDEMQEQKLLKIEHNGFWFAFFGLFAAIMIQLALGVLISVDDTLRHDILWHIFY